MLVVLFVSVVVLLLGGVVLWEAIVSKKRVRRVISAFDEAHDYLSLPGGGVTRRVFFYKDTDRIARVSFFNARGELHNPFGPSLVTYCPDGGISSMSFYLNGVNVNSGFKLPDKVVFMDVGREECKNSAGYVDAFDCFGECGWKKVDVRTEYYYWSDRWGVEDGSRLEETIVNGFGYSYFTFDGARVEEDEWLGLTRSYRLNYELRVRSSSLGNGFRL